MINVQGIRRNMKNVVKNYSDAQVKVREATSNDPWGPSSTLMSEIADLTYNVVAFSEIMQMIWKRLNDHGKNWRHVYKALVLLEYLIKTGSEKVAQQCRENIFAIQTLKDFQYIEENKDQGMNVREKSKLLVALLKDDEKLKTERTRALKAKERFAQSMSYMGSSGSIGETIPRTSASYHESLSSSGDHYGAFGPSSTGRVSSSELEAARPQTVGEEELQLQLALAMSKEEAEQEERLRKNDDLRLRLALNESEKAKSPPEPKSAIDDLLSLNVGPQPTAGLSTDPWGVPLSNKNAVGNNSLLQNKPKTDPWNSQPILTNPSNDPWETPVQLGRTSANNDPWQPSPTTTPIQSDPWAPLNENGSKMMISPTLDIDRAFNTSGSPSTEMSFQTATRKTPENFLGPNSNLVNLDALVSTKNSVLPAGGNPFAPQPSTTALSNPFQTSKPPQPTINQLRAQNQFTGPFDSNVLLHQSSVPLQPTPLQNSGNLFQNNSQSTHNPFSM